ncbi:glycosyltransferase, partial [Candidatus Roizmanbacteria bacterium CG_4_10_14_3_um_filter_39_13]
MISIIIPFYNEEKNIPILLQEIDEVMRKENKPFEVVLVDDGSEKKIQTPNSNSIKLIEHKKRMGKGEALKTGMSHANGNIIIFMDGDLQDDPHDFPSFFAKLEDGYDLVNGIRSKRKDTGIIQLYSHLANSVLRNIFKSPFTDINCGFKAFKREVLENMPLYGNNFRFLPLSAYYQGFKVAEIPVNNRKRIHGESKFGMSKLFIGLLDMTTAYFVFKFAERPLHFFGTMGGILFSAGFFISLYLAYERIFFNVLLYRRPLLQLGIVL